MCSASMRSKFAPAPTLRSSIGAARVCLSGRVRRIEPAAFTKISTLGVEEQRVNVLIDVLSPREQWAGLGDGYQVDTRITVFTQDDIAIIPAGALFRRGDSWSVYVVDDGRAQLRAVDLVRRSGRFAAVSKGRCTRRPGYRLPQRSNQSRCPGQFEITE